MPTSRPTGETAALTLDFMEAFIAREETHFAANHSPLRLESHFQPIYSLAHQRTVGFEALIRPYLPNGEPISPIALFSDIKTLADTVFLDRLCRTLHVRNFARQADDSTWLFLNINPLVMTHGKKYGAFFSRLLQRYGIPPHRVVVEILEEQIDDETLLAESIRYYRNMGCLIAIDDFGVGQSNFDRIWRLAPHIVKLDKSVIEQAASNRSVGRVLPSLVSLIHQAGSLVLIEGVETAEQAMIAMQSDMDFVQGFYFARPACQLPKQTRHTGITALFETLRERDQYDEDTRQTRLATYTSCFFDASIGIRSGEEALSSLAAFLALPEVRRCYLLDELGKQVGHNFLPEGVAGPDDPRFTPLQDVSHAIWARRHYYREAVEEPGSIQISKPYLSISGGGMCITLSIAIGTPDGLRVLCGDIYSAADS
jgi:EAL domain-containing protein (putative c-di-GMP-specific phosphodiesterase class I)